MRKINNLIKMNKGLERIFLYIRNIVNKYMKR